MKLLTIVKATGANFIRHYLPYFPAGSDVAYTPQTAFDKIESGKFDVVLFEWANDLTAQIINSEQFYAMQSRLKFITVVRIHDHEVRKQFAHGRRIDYINWGRVDKIWFINPTIKKLFHELKGDGGNSFLIPNAIDLSLFAENQAGTKKIGLVSLFFRERKRIDRVADVARLLPDWEFEIRVEIPRTKGGEYWDQFMKLRSKAKDLNNIIIQDRPVRPVELSHYENEDLVQWYADKAVILSTSSWEGYHYALGEGMASGCMPVVWNWPDAKHFWGPYVVTDAEDAAERIAAYKPSWEYRQYIINNYDAVFLAREVVREIGKG